MSHNVQSIITHSLVGEIERKIESIVLIVEDLIFSSGASCNLGKLNKVNLLTWKGQVPLLFPNLSWKWWNWSHVQLFVFVLTRKLGPVHDTVSLFALRRCWILYKGKDATLLLSKTRFNHLSNWVKVRIFWEENVRFGRLLEKNESTLKTGRFIKTFYTKNAKDF